MTTIVRGYDQARICLNGHVIDHEIQRSGRPSQLFCDICGANVISTCPKCPTPIRGSFATYTPMYQSDPEVEYDDYLRPAYCYQCGTPLPWTASALDAANELTDTIKGLNPRERQELRDAFPDLITESPRTTVAAMRFRSLVAKGGEEAVHLFAAHFADLMVARAAALIPFMHH